MSESESIAFEDMFNLEEIQNLQDLFANATGVASIITKPDGTPITKASNFTYLCSQIIRKTKKGLCNCYQSDATIGRFNPSGPIIQPCLSGGLWDAGASISVGGKHIANWLIGQVRNDTQKEDNMRHYANEIGADEEEFMEAFRKVPTMPRSRFEMISNMLFSLAKQLSKTAYQNVMKSRFISERKKTEEELQHLRNYLFNIIDSMPSVLVGVDATGHITLWNAEAQRTTGLSPLKAIGKSLAEVLPRLDSQMENVCKAMQTRKTLSATRKMRRKGDEIRYEDVTIYPLVANGVEGAVIRIDDVTDNVRIEEVMVQTEKMMSVGGLAAGMAHEINNPLAGMMQTANVLARRLSKDMPSNLQAASEAGTTMEAIRAFMTARGIPEMLKYIRESGSRAAEIVANMLSFARKSDSTFSTNSIPDLLDQSVFLAGSDYDLKKKYDFRQIEILRQYEPDLPMIPCETGKIQQVLLNILRNGAEAMQEALKEDPQRKPRFILRVSFDRDNEEVRIEIEDNGPGMDETTRKRVFEPFFTTKPLDRGTGLGLSVSYFIITENHNGSMSVESSPGNGTKFIICLPIRRKKL